MSLGNRKRKCNCGNDMQGTIGVDFAMDMSYPTDRYIMWVCDKCETICTETFISDEELLNKCFVFR